MKKWTTLMLARAGVIAALYTALTFACFPVASGNVQFRISEMLTLLPLFYVEAIPALFVGCLLSNIISGCVLWDIALGSLVTLTAAVLTHFMGKLFKNAFLRITLGGAFPVILNALFLPLIWWLSYGELSVGYWLNVGFLLLSQGVIIWGAGTALYFALNGLLNKRIAVLLPIRPDNRE
ncbi:MAG: QueT transporter family protein [Clostridia bacterium]|nr:QueT transporter family protein [Clostridia bacterium]